MIVAILSLILALVAPVVAAQDEVEAFDPHPLRPADTSSPRDALYSFNANVNEAMQAWRAGESYDAIVQPGERAFETFDFSELPKRGRRGRQIRSALFLKEILDRIELPPDEEIPGDAEVGSDDRLTSWTIPNTRITIAKLKEGPRASEFLFTAETVRRLEEFYERAKHLPYKPGALVGIYEDYIYSFGLAVPQRWARWLPAWSKTVVLGEALWQWIGFAIVAVAAFLIIRLLLRWGRRWDERHRRAGALTRLGLPLGVFASVGVLVACREVALKGLRLIGDIWVPLSSILWTLIFAGVGWLIFLMTDRIAVAINDARQVKEGSIDGQLVRTLLRLVSLALVVALVLYAADFFGIPLTPVLAGLGVGGLAIALAVRPTLENIIGGLTLFGDKPVRIGEFCSYGDKIGTVEEIGLRSTRVRSLDRTLVTIPNADFSQLRLVNYSRRDMMLYHFTIGLRYETTTDQLRYVLAKVREMLLGHPRVDREPARIRFKDFGAYSLDLEIFAHVRSNDWDQYLAIREDLNLRIMDIVAEAGTGFAFPSQTAYLGRDAGLDAERGREAEEKVRFWRERRKLPFPEFEDEESERLEDILDYPPKGSPDYQPRSRIAEPPPEPKRPRAGGGLTR